MIEWLLLGVAAGAAAGAWLRYRRGRKKQAHWQGLLGDAAKRLSGRVSAGASGDAELRAEIDGGTVTLKLYDFERGPGQGRAEASTPLADSSDTSRYYLGWDLEKTPGDLSHIPLVEGTGSTRYEGKLEVRAEQPALAHVYAREAAGPLSDLRLDAGASGLSLLVRGGYLTLTLVGLDEATPGIAKVASVARKLALAFAQARTAAASPEARALAATASAEIERCELCTDKRADEPWVQCARCKAGYHKACFLKVGACPKDGCGEQETVSA